MQSPGLSEVMKDRSAVEDEQVNQQSSQIAWLTDAPAAIVCSITEQH